MSLGLVGFTTVLSDPASVVCGYCDRSSSIPPAMVRLASSPLLSVTWVHLTVPPLVLPPITFVCCHAISPQGVRSLWGSFVVWPTSHCRLTQEGNKPNGCPQGTLLLRSSNNVIELFARANDPVITDGDPSSLVVSELSGEPALAPLLGQCSLLPLRTSCLLIHLRR